MMNTLHLLKTLSLSVALTGVVSTSLLATDTTADTNKVAAVEKKEENKTDSTEKKTVTEAVKDTAADTIAAIPGAVKDAAGRARAAIHAATEPSVDSSAKEKSSETVEKVADKSQDIKESAKEEWEAAKQNLQLKIHAAMEKGKVGEDKMLKYLDLTTEEFKALKEKAASKVEGLKESIKDAFKNEQQDMNLSVYKKMTEDKVSEEQIKEYLSLSNDELKDLKAKVEKEAEEAKKTQEKK